MITRKRNRVFLATLALLLCLPMLGISQAVAQDTMQERLDGTLTENDRAFLNSLGIDSDDPYFTSAYHQEIEKVNKAGERVPLSILFAACYKGDGCTFSPDSWGKANFYPACDAHDTCYSKTSSDDRLVCDQRFYSQLVEICDAAYPSNDHYYKNKACHGISYVYYKAVRQFGGSHYEGTGKNN